ncbi:MAG TPA: hypothetical protein VEV43_08130 [Actinomycetota bacterium]|nr:hypothetical protein [Actinomycetota bacterium]
MRRTLAVTIAAALLVGGAVAGTGHAKARRVKVERHDSAGYVGAKGSAGAEPTIYVDEGIFETERYERDVSVTVIDRTGQAVAGLVRQDADGDGTWEIEEAFCGATAEPVAIEGGAPVVVKVQPGPCADGTPAVMTSGSIRVAFTGFTKAPAVPAPSLGCAPTKAAREITEKYVLASGAGAATEAYPVGFFELADDEAIGGAQFVAGCGEGRLEVTLTDQTGLPTRAAIAVDPDGVGGDAPQDFVAEVCGTTESPVAITPGAEVTIFVVEGPCSDGTPATATTGTVTATLTAPAK